VFVPCSVEIKSNYKVNMEEAEKCIKLLIQISKIYSENNMTISQDTIGVITPYRAQIALIKSMLPDNISDLVTVDTVERFQGGARDIIIFSTCTNRQSQLESLVSLSHEGVDRKLNVAITRAKEQFIMLGNETILLKNQVYANLIQYSKQYIMEI
jgi:DNA replication ATP-dependent helicase Dna2